MDLVRKKTQDKPFSEVNSNINIIEHIITAGGLVDDEKFQITLSLSNFNGAVEFKNSTDFTDIGRCKLFPFVEEIIGKLEFKNTDYKRIGIRIFAIDTKEVFKFDRILKYILNSNSLFINSLSENLPTVNDTALTFESINDNKESFRLILGAYQEKEKKKYFTIDPDIKEGMIFDLDVWQSKISIQGFNLTNMIRQNIKLYSQILPKLSKNLEEELTK